MSNPAQISKNSRYKQGYYKPKNPSKYIGDAEKIVYRSSWERILCYKFDRNPDIIGWLMEYKIPYIKPTTGKTHRYYVDFLTVSINKQNNEKVVTLIEVKPEAQTRPPKKQGKRKSRYLKECLDYEVNLAKWKYAQAYCKEKGWNFVILTERTILGK